jgi:hypothetical protein
MCVSCVMCCDWQERLVVSFGEDKDRGVCEDVVVFDGLQWSDAKVGCAMEHRDLDTGAVYAPLGRRDHAGAVIGAQHDRVLFFGGRQGNRAWLDDTFLLDNCGGDSMQWVPVHGSNDASPCGRFGHSLVAMGALQSCTTMALFGGKRGARSLLDDLWLFDLHRMEWRPSGVRGGRKPSRRAFHFSAALDEPGNCLLVMGGETEPRGPLDETKDVDNLYFIDVREGVWHVPALEHTNHSREDLQALLGESTRRNSCYVVPSEEEVSLMFLMSKRILTLHTPSLMDSSSSSYPFSSSSSPSPTPFSDALTEAATATATPPSAVVLTPRPGQANSNTLPSSSAAHTHTPAHAPSLFNDAISSSLSGIAAKQSPPASRLSNSRIQTSIAPMQVGGKIPTGRSGSATALVPLTSSSFRVFLFGGVRIQVNGTEGQMSGGLRCLTVRCDPKPTSESAIVPQTQQQQQQHSSVDSKSPSLAQPVTPVGPRRTSLSPRTRLLNLLSPKQLVMTDTPTHTQEGKHARTSGGVGGRVRAPPGQQQRKQLEVKLAEASVKSRALPVSQVQVVAHNTRPTKHPSMSSSLRARDYSMGMRMIMRVCTYMLTCV